MIQAHQQKVKILAELELEICQKQNQKTLTNIHEINNSDEPRMAEVKVGNNY